MHLVLLYLYLTFPPRISEPTWWAHLSYPPTTIWFFQMFHDTIFWVTLFLKSSEQHAKGCVLKGPILGACCTALTCRCKKWHTIPRSQVTAAIEKQQQWSNRGHRRSPGTDQCGKVDRAGRGRNGAENGRGMQRLRRGQLFPFWPQSPLPVPLGTVPAKSEQTLCGRGGLPKGDLWDCSPAGCSMCSSDAAPSVVGGH